MEITFNITATETPKGSKRPATLSKSTMWAADAADWDTFKSRAQMLMPMEMLAALNELLDACPEHFARLAQEETEKSTKSGEKTNGRKRKK